MSSMYIPYVTNAAHMLSDLIRICLTPSRASYKHETTTYQTYPTSEADYIPIWVLTSSTSGSLSTLLGYKLMTERNLEKQVIFYTPCVILKSKFPTTSRIGLKEDKGDRQL